jgi:hemoglobin-like flavoprotein
LPLVGQDNSPVEYCELPRLYKYSISNTTLINWMCNMTPHQIKLVQDSFATVMLISDTAAQLFYQRLFETDQSASKLFKGDMKEQGRKLMQMIGVAVKGLDRLESIVPAVQALGRRHKNYKVTESQYDTVGASLLWTLQQGLGETFTADTRDAWTAAYSLLATTMKDAARSA